MRHIFWPTLNWPEMAHIIWSTYSTSHPVCDILFIDNIICYNMDNMIWPYDMVGYHFRREFKLWSEWDFRDLEAGDLGVINGVDNLTKMPNGNLLTNAHRPKWNSELTFLQIINPLYYPADQIGKYTARIICWKLYGQYFLHHIRIWSIL